MPDTLNLSEQWSPESSRIAAAQTYRVDFKNKKVSGRVDRSTSVLQFAEKVLSTDKYAYEIYNWYYGNELFRLAGKPYEFIVAEIPRIVREALLTDDRVLDTKNFVFKRSSIDSVTVTFDIVHVYGTDPFKLEVSI